MKLVHTLIFVLLITGCAENNKSKQNAGADHEYIVAAYVWPSCHDDEMASEKLWSEGIGEWEIIQKGNPRFGGHYQPRVPLWGYKMDDDPLAWEQKIKAALEHGVNAFIFDWYWYDGKPFLEAAINDGFLGAKNNHEAFFYLMWANHDVPGNMWNHFRYDTDSLLWNGETDWDNFRIIVDRVINQYFKKSNYLKIDNEPVFSIYSLSELINSFGDLEGTKEALDFFRAESKKHGFPGVHFQLIGWDRDGGPCFSGVEQDVNEVVDFLSINSITLYNMASSNYRKEDYIRYGEGSLMLREKWDAMLDIPFFPIVSVGWDNTPRYPEMGMEAVIHYHNTPTSFGTYLSKAKKYADEHPEQEKLIIINAWNEWVEGSYLEPDMLWGYEYLEAVKKVMEGGWK